LMVAWLIDGIVRLTVGFIAKNQQPVPSTSTAEAATGQVPQAQTTAPVTVVRAWAGLHTALYGVAAISSGIMLSQHVQPGHLVTDVYLFRYLVLTMWLAASTIVNLSIWWTHHVGTRVDAYLDFIVHAFLGGTVASTADDDDLAFDTIRIVIGVYLTLWNLINPILWYLSDTAALQAARSEAPPTVSNPKKEEDVLGFDTYLTMLPNLALVSGCLAIVASVGAGFLAFTLLVENTSEFAGPSAGTNPTAALVGVYLLLGISLAVILSALLFVPLGFGCVQSKNCCRKKQEVVFENEDLQLMTMSRF